MKHYSWDPEKNSELMTQRGMSFERITDHIERGDVVEILEHPNPERYANQKIMVIRIEDYCWLVPFVESGEQYFLKTAFPSRRATKQYLEGGT